MPRQVSTLECIGLRRGILVSTFTEVMGASGKKFLDDRHWVKLRDDDQSDVVDIATPLRTFRSHISAHRVPSFGYRRHNGLLKKFRKIVGV
jgi:hypothetical protein